MSIQASNYYAEDTQVCMLKTWNHHDSCQSLELNDYDRLAFLWVFMKKQKINYRHRLRNRQKVLAQPFDFSNQGLPKFYGDSEGGGGYAFFTGTFPEKDHPPQQKILNSPLIWRLAIEIHPTTRSRATCDPAGSSGSTSVLQTSNLWMEVKCLVLPS